MKSMSDQQLALAVQSGDRAAAQVLMERYQDGLFGLALRLLRNREDAAEVAQEAMVKALARIGSYDATRPFSPWVYRIARNLCIDRHRRRRPSYEIDEERDAAPVAHEGTNVFARPPDALVHQHRLNEALDEALEGLGAIYREIIVLYHYDHMTYSEIAVHLDIPEGTVMNRLFRARKKMQAALVAKGITP
jgi:RNA polymerase sigma-70 factor (ECF subfamily)